MSSKSYCAAVVRRKLSSCQAQRVLASHAGWGGPPKQALLDACLHPVEAAQRFELSNATKQASDALCRGLMRHPGCSPIFQCYFTGQAVARENPVPERVCLAKLSFAAVVRTAEDRQLLLAPEGAMLQG